MTTPLKSTVGRIKLSTTVYAVKNITLSYEAAGDQSNHSALRMPTNVRIAGAQVPTVSFQMFAADALAAFGLDLTSTATFEAYFANLIGAIVDSSSTHTKVGLQTSPSGAVCCSFIDGWSVSEGGEWMCDVRAYFFSADGDTDPVKQTSSVALPALTAMPVIHGIGIFTPNAVALPGMIGNRYQSGLSISIQRTDGLRYATGGAPSGFKPIIRIEHADPIGLAAILGSEGVEISDTTTLTFMKYLTTGKLSATGQKTITTSAGRGFIRPVAASVDNGQLFKGGCELILSSSDGVTHPAVLS